MQNAFLPCTSSPLLKPYVRAKHGERSAKHLFAFDSRHFSNISEVITSGGTGKDGKTIGTHDQEGRAKTGSRDHDRGEMQRRDQMREDGQRRDHDQGEGQRLACGASGACGACSACGTALKALP